MQTAVGGVEGEQDAQRGLATRERVRAALEVAVRHAAEALDHELDVGILALAEVALEVGADEGDPLVAEGGHVGEPGQDPGAVVRVGGRELQRTRALPQGDDRDGRAAQVVQEPRLVLHVAQEDDRVRVPGLQHGRQRDLLVEPTLGVTEDDVVAVRHRLDRQRLDRAGPERVAEVAHDRADEHRRRAAQAAGQGVRPVAEPARGEVHPLARLLGDGDARRGVVEDPRDRALRDLGRDRDVAHGRDRSARRRGPGRGVGRRSCAVGAGRARSSLLDGAPERPRPSPLLPDPTRRA